VENVAGMFAVAKASSMHSYKLCRAKSLSCDWMSTVWQSVL